MHQLTSAQLWIGQPSAIQSPLIHYLQKIYCKHGCGNCATCNTIVERQFHLIEWIEPENSYTLEDLDPIFNRIGFALDPDQKVVFILNNAERLTPSCANKLLKSLEEPPPGYHFILCSAYKEALLPTIISRCTIHTLGQESFEIQHQELLKFFLPPSQDFIGLYTYLETNKFPEHYTQVLLEKLLHEYFELYAKSFAQNPQSSTLYKKIIVTLEAHMKQLPMPGSNKLFWKNLLLQLQHIKD